MQGLTEGFLELVGREVLGVEQYVIRLGAPGGRLGHGEEFDQRPVRQSQPVDQRRSLRVQAGGEVLPHLGVRRPYGGAQALLVRLGGDGLAPPGQPDDDLERLADTVGDQ